MENIKLRPKTFIQPPDAIVIGSSTGGLQALSKIFEDLKDCIIDIPILITQHIPENFDHSFSTRIEETAGRKCVVATDNQLIENGVIYFAPSEKHMLIKSGDSNKYIEINDAPPVNFCKPSVDILFKSASKAYGKNLIAIILTGIGNDGLEGAKEVAATGGAVIAQDKDSSIVWGMPGAVSRAGICNDVLPLEKISWFIREYSFGKVRDNLRIKLSAANLKFFKDYFLKKCGTVLNDDKSYLIETRLIPVIKKYDMDNFDELTNNIKKGHKDLISDCMDAILTNETYFFRDQKLFKIFEDELIAKLVKNSDDNVIRLWSCACSSGQEPYSMAITMLENSNRLKGKEFEILATDISGKILKKAMNGIYNPFEIQRGLPDRLIEKYFDEIPGNKWKIKDSIKKYIKFTEWNLLDKFNFPNKFDGVFCRYVLIYFEEKMKKQILRKISEMTKSDGIILLGASETNNLMPELFNQYEKLRSVFFKKN